MKEKLLGKDLKEMREAAIACGLKAFVGNQLCDWLYVKRIRSFDEMTNIAKASREKLAAKYELGKREPAGKAVTSDGTTK